MPKENVSPSPETPVKFDPVAFGQKWLALMDRARPVMTAALNKMKGMGEVPVGAQPIDPLHLASAMAEFWGHYARHPSQFVEWQMQYLADLGGLWAEQQQKFLGQGASDAASPVNDRRFRDPLWHDNVAFDFLRRAYLLTRQSVEQRLRDQHSLSGHDRRRLEFYSQLFFDALSPSNFATTNPEVIREVLNTGGDNLLRGLENLIEDLERGEGDLKISTTNYTAFAPGKNLATTPGKVVVRTRMMELIQYAPSTKKVHATPVLIVPPWINKYYILDLRAHNSLVKYLVDQGFTVFMTSWVNPDARYASAMFDDYLQDGLFAALDAIQSITKTNATHVMGYCIGGTLTAMGLSVLRIKRRDSRVASATLLTTLLDFHQAGDMHVFIDEAQIREIEIRMKEQGFLDASALQKTFAMLRANDMIWSFVVNNYLMGREPFPFDLLYWNEDSTNLPAAFHAYYLRHMYLRNDLIKPKKLSISGVPIDLSTIKTPLYFLSTKDDHIAPWLATYDGARLLAAKNKNVRFVLAASGHVAGVVNPPVAEKYNHWVGGPVTKSPEEWLSAARNVPGSWWGDWAAWAKKTSPGPMSAPPSMGNNKYPAITDAPGTYVLVKARDN